MNPTYFSIMSYHKKGDILKNTMNKLLSPSILSADFNVLGSNIECVEREGADYLHIDVMDGSFVPSISFGMPVIKSIRGKSSLFFDVHLMIVDPVRYIKDFVEAGADGITFHLEADRDPERTIGLIHSEGKKAGIAINPETPLEELKDDIIKLADMVLIMTVHPGFGGQSYIGECTEKIRILRQRAEKLKPELNIEVDGGINKETIHTVLDAGANVIVMGSAVFGGDIAENMKYYKKVLG